MRQAYIFWSSLLTVLAVLALQAPSIVQAADSWSDFEFSAASPVSGGAGSSDGRGPFWRGNGRQNVSLRGTLINTNANSATGTITLNAYLGQYWLGQTTWTSILAGQSTGVISIPLVITTNDAIPEGSYRLTLKLTDWGGTRMVQFQDDTLAWSPDNYRLRFSTAPANAGTINVNGTTASLGETFVPGSVTENLLASVAAGHQFSNWSSAGCTVNNTASASTYIRANFMNATIMATFNSAPQPPPTIVGALNGDTYIARDQTCQLKGIIQSAQGNLQTVTVVVSQPGGAIDGSTYRFANVNAQTFDLGSVEFDPKLFAPLALVLNGYTLGVWASNAGSPQGVLLHEFDCCYSDQRSLSEYDAELLLPWAAADNARVARISQWENSLPNQYHDLYNLERRAIDFAMPFGTRIPILAPCAMIVVKVQRDRTKAYGLYVDADVASDPRLRMRFAHLDSLDSAMMEGAIVQCGHVIGISGNTPESAGFHEHLHFQIWDHTLPDSQAAVRILPIDGFVTLGVDADPDSTNFTNGGTGYGGDDDAVGGGTEQAQGSGGCDATHGVGRPMNGSFACFVLAILLLIACSRRM
ncbi:MAG: M23 family metallopeptidase [Planctomycetota bacterium]